MIQTLMDGKFLARFVDGSQSSIRPGDDSDYYYPMTFEEFVPVAIQYSPWR